MSNYWQEKITIGKQSFPRFMSAPMDGVTDSPFRQLIRDFSKEELLYTEMRHIAAVANQKDGKSLQYNKIEQPLAFQFSGNTTNFLEQSVEKVLNRKFIQINLNAGCPAKNVVKSGSGSALMANPKLLKEIIITLQKAINGRVPLTLKIRAGFKEKNALEIALMAQDLGIAALIIHPRTRQEKFSGELDFEIVKKIKNKLKIPVIFSGGIKTFEDAKTAYEKTDVDGFMIGRALMGEPWKLKELKEASEGKTFTVDIKTRIKYAIKHLDLNIKFYGNAGVHKLKAQLPHYIKNIDNAATIRGDLLRSQNEEEMREKLENLLKQYS